jgi:hypothetical protein
MLHFEIRGPSLQSAKGFAFCLASLSASGDVLRTAGLPAAF